MKKISYFLGIAAALILGCSSCKEGTDFEVEMVTPLHPVGGQYYGYVYSFDDASMSDADFWKSVAQTITYDATNDVVMFGTGKELEFVTENYCYLSNTTDYAADKCWLRFGAVTAAKDFNINCKLGFNAGDFSFKGTNVGNYRGNAAEPRPGENVSVVGYAFHNTYTTLSQGVDDELFYVYSLENEPGVHYVVWAWKVTGWPEDEELVAGPELVRILRAHADKL